MHHKKKSAAARAPYLPAGVPRYSMIKGFVVVTNWIRTSTSGSKRQAQRTTIHSDCDFVYPVHLAQKKQMITSGRVSAKTLESRLKKTCYKGGPVIVEPLPYSLQKCQFPFVSC